MSQYQVTLQLTFNDALMFSLIRQ